MKPVPTGTAAQATGSVEEAAEAIGKFLISSEDEEQQGQAGEPGAEGEQEAAAEEAPGSETETEGEQPEAEVEEEAGEEEEQGEQPAPDKLYTVRIDGKEERVPESELIAGYSRTSDYTRKTQALSEQRKKLESETEETARARTEYGQLLPKLRAALETGMGPEPDWNKLRVEDPAKAAVLWQEREDMRRKVARVQSEERRVAEEQERENAVHSEQIAIEQHNELLKKLPEWRDEKVAGAETTLIVKMLTDLGFSPKEQEIYDHRVLMIARKAAKYDEYVARQKALKPKMKLVPVLKPGTVVKPSPTKETDALNARLKRTGSVRDAANLIEKFLS
jgi:hypothetical protein